MARIALKDGVLLIDSEVNGVAVSIKPTDDRLRYWGNCGGFNYSILASDVKSVIVIRNKATDKVWVDSRVTLPITYLDRVVVNSYDTAVRQLDQRVKP